VKRFKLYRNNNNNNNSNNISRRLKSSGLLIHVGW